MHMERALSEDLWYAGGLSDASGSSRKQGDTRPMWGSPDRSVLSDSDTEDVRLGSSSVSRKERRKTFPAGRIYHLLPAYLVFGKFLSPSRFNDCSSHACGSDLVKKDLSEVDGVL